MAADEESKPTGFFARIKAGLTRTREVLGRPLLEIARGGADRESTLSSLEEALIAADVGPAVAAEILKELRSRKEVQDFGAALREDLLKVLAVPGPSERAPAVTPRVIFFVGVNGTGKTTSMGKLAARLKLAGAKPLLAACDTFRAAAVEQLLVWAERASVPMIRQAAGADPGAVLHDAISRAKERGESPVLVDTAGRLHVKSHLMEEMAKMTRVAGRLVEGAPHESWLVVDATTGQNGIAQAREFAKVVPLTGLVLTKLDGTAKGGVALAIVREFGVPIRLVGVGEGVDDLLDFDAAAYVDGLIGAASS